MTTLSRPVICSVSNVSPCKCCTSSRVNLGSQRVSPRAVQCITPGIDAENGLSTVSSILKLLEQWPAWRRITQAPAEIDALRRRVEMLEATLRAPGRRADECPACHSLTWRIVGNRKDADFGDMGVSYDQWRCSTCGRTQEVEAR
jgi:hypothetical protein